MANKIKRSKTDTVIAGVCGGIAEYLNVDTPIIRLAFVFATFFGGIGPIAYIIGVFVMSDGKGHSHDRFDSKADDYDMNDYDKDRDFSQVMGDIEPDDSCTQRSSSFVGISLILLGGMFLLKRFIGVDLKDLLPILLVVIGLLVVFKNGRKNQ